jgi:hypothetical protein
MRPERVETSDMSKQMEETRIAEKIVSVLPAGVARALSPDRETIRYAVRGDGMKLRTIVLRRASLRRLLEDAACEIKVEYLQRELLRTAESRTEFRYPRPIATVIRGAFSAELAKLGARHPVSA